MKPKQIVIPPQHVETFKFILQYVVNADDRGEVFDPEYEYDEYTGDGDWTEEDKAFYILFMDWLKEQGIVDEQSGNVIFATE